MINNNNPPINIKSVILKSPIENKTIFKSKEGISSDDGAGWLGVVGLGAEELIVTVLSEKDLTVSVPNL